MTYEQQLSRLWSAAKSMAEHHEYCAKFLAPYDAENMVEYHHKSAKEKRAEMHRILERLPAREDEKEAA